MDEGTGKFHSPSAGDIACDAEIFWRSIPCRIFLNLLVLPSVGFVLMGGMAALLLGIFSISAAKLVILPARGLLLFYEYLCSLAGKLRWSTWIGGEPEIWQILVYYVF